VRYNGFWWFLVISNDFQWFLMISSNRNQFVPPWEFLLKFANFHSRHQKRQMWSLITCCIESKFKKKIQLLSVLMNRTFKRLWILTRLSQKYRLHSWRLQDSERLQKLWSLYCFHCFWQGSVSKWYSFFRLRHCSFNEAQLTIECRKAVRFPVRSILRY